MRRAARVCASMDCVTVIPSSRKYCEACLKKIRKKDNDRRGKYNRKIYNRDWERVRAAHLKAFPFCVDCGKPGNQVDHILPVSKGGARLDPANLATRCISCHSKKTASQDGGFGNKPKMGVSEKNGFDLLINWLDGDKGVKNA